MASSSAPLGTLIVLAVAGGIAGGAGTAYVLREDAPAARVDRGYDDAALRGEMRALREELQRLQLRVVDAETPMAEAARETSSTIEVEKPVDPDAAPAEAGASERKAVAFEPKKYVESLRGKHFSVRDNDALITRLSMSVDQIDPTIDALKAAIKADPSNPDLYAALASAHVAKLAAGVAAGPAAGPVYMQALGAYNKAIELQPDHWDARFSRAFTTSMAPEFVGLRPTSIKEFEDLVQRQESLPKQEEFSRTYMRLGTLYKDAGNTNKAREIWTKGLQRFPDDDQIKAALAVLEKE